MCDPVLFTDHETATGRNLHRVKLKQLYLL